MLEKVRSRAEGYHLCNSNEKVCHSISFFQNCKAKSSMGSFTIATKLLRIRGTDVELETIYLETRKKNHGYGQSVTMKEISLIMLEYIQMAIYGT
jgi:hypothetical protein